MKITMLECPTEKDWMEVKRRALVTVGKTPINPPDHRWKEKILIAVHCENHGIVTYFRECFVQEGKTQARWHPVSRPAEAEAEAVSRLLYLAQAAGEAPVYVVHLSTRKGLEEIHHGRIWG